MSTSIEGALIKKREQQRYQVSKCILLWFCFFFLYVGAFVLFSNMSQGMETQTELAPSVENTEQGAERASTNESYNANLQTEDTTSGGREVIHAILFLLGLIGVLCSCVGFVIFYIIRFIKWFLTLEGKRSVK